MTTRTTVLAAICAIVAGTTMVAARGEARDSRSRVARSRAPFSPRSVWDSVFTAEQARRGEAIYKARCLRCHKEALTGLDDIPPLSGKTFLGNWNGSTAADLHERIFTTMPSDSAGVLDRGQITDVMSYLFSFNGFPAGKSEMQKDTEYLKEIRIESSRP